MLFEAFIMVLTVLWPTLHATPNILQLVGYERNLDLQ